MTGGIFAFRVRPPGEQSYTPLPDGNRMEIGSGSIVNGQFTGTLRGIDSNPNAPLDTSVRGFEGDVLGEFYGPGAEEVAGVLNAKRTEDDTVAMGWFGGRQFSPTVPDGNLSVLSVAIRQEFFRAFYNYHGRRCYSHFERRCRWF